MLGLSQKLKGKRREKTCHYLTCMTWIGITLECLLKLCTSYEKKKKVIF